MSALNFILQVGVPLAATVLTGGAAAPMAATAMRTLGTQVAMAGLQRLGQEMGVPMSVISFAQMALAQSSGQPGIGQQDLAQTVSSVARDLNLSPSEEGQLNRQVNVILEKFVKDALEGSNNGDDNSATSKSKDGKRDSFLVAFAKAMGKTMDNKMNRMMELSKQIDAETQRQNGSKGKYQAVTGQLSAELQGIGQELSMVAQAMATALKSIGEAITAVARKG